MKNENNKEHDVRAYFRPRIVVTITAYKGDVYKNFTYEQKTIASLYDLSFYSGNPRLTKYPQLLPLVSLNFSKEFTCTQLFCPRATYSNPCSVTFHYFSLLKNSALYNDPHDEFAAGTKRPAFCITIFTTRPKNFSYEYSYLRLYIFHRVLARQVCTDVAYKR